MVFILNDLDFSKLIFIEITV